MKRYNKSEIYVSFVKDRRLRKSFWGLNNTVQQNISFALNKKKVENLKSVEYLNPSKCRLK